MSVVWHRVNTKIYVKASLNVSTSMRLANISWERSLVMSPNAQLWSILHKEFQKRTTAVFIQPLTFNRLCGWIIYVLFPMLPWLLHWPIWKGRSKIHTNITLWEQKTEETLIHPHLLHSEGLCHLKMYFTLELCHTKTGV